MNNINLKIDVSKLDKERFVKNTYTKRDGTEVTELNADLVVIEKKEHKVIKDGDTWVLKETHFVAEAQTKEEREVQKPSNFVGSGTQFFDKGESKEVEGAIKYPEDEIDPNDVPF